MKKLVVIAGVLAIFGASASTADARGYTCTYKIPGTGGAVVTVDGSYNRPEFCRLLNSELGGVRVPNSNAPIICAWKMRHYEVYVSVKNRNRSMGQLLCSFMAEGLSPSDWVRVR